MESPPILFIIINYFNEQEINKFIDHLKLQDTINYSIVLVINGTNDLKTLKDISTNNSNVLLSSPSENLGYLPGANFGFQEYIKNGHAFPELAIVCNTDITISDHGFLNKLLKSPGEVKGPAIISSKTRLNQNPFSEKRIGKSKLQFLLLIFSFYPFYLIYRSMSVIKGRIKSASEISNTNARIVYALHGSFLVFTRSYFEKSGDLNYPCFLFGEEIFIAERSRRLGINLTYLPQLKIQHDEHVHTGIFKSPKLVNFMADSTKYLLNTFFK